jgi:hypothetical protein
VPARQPGRAHHPLRLCAVPVPHRPSYLHGPYPSWIRKVGARTVTRTLNPAQLEQYRPLFDNTKKLA